jgi:hypothetical protein
MLLKMIWRGEELKMFNTVEPASKRKRGGFFFAGSRRVRYTRILASGTSITRREKVFLDKSGTHVIL